MENKPKSKWQFWKWFSRAETSVSAANLTGVQQLLAGLLTVLSSWFASLHLSWLVVTPIAVLGVSWFILAKLSRILRDGHRHTSLQDDSQSQRREQASLMQSAGGVLGDEEDRVNAWKQQAIFWEFRYLNHYLVRGTQMVLDWLVANQSPVSPVLYHSSLAFLVPSEQERTARLEALKLHELIHYTQDGLIELTEKGSNYIQWRGPIQYYQEEFMPPAS